MSLYFENLIVWQKAFLLVEKTHHIIKKFPKEEQFALTDQLRRCSLSIVSNIAEGNGRGTNGDYAHFLCISKGSCMEYYTQILLAQKFGYLISQEAKELLELTEEIVKMLSTMIHNKK